MEPFLAGEPVSYGPFDWEKGGVSRDIRRMGSPSVLIIEGVFAMSPLLGRQHSFGVWVEAPRSVRLSRGLARDGEGARARWTELWMPREDRYFEETRPDLNADLLVDGAKPSPQGTFWRSEETRQTTQRRIICRDRPNT